MNDDIYNHGYRYVPVPVKKENMTGTAPSGKKNSWIDLKCFFLLFSQRQLADCSEFLLHLISEEYIIALDSSFESAVTDAAWL